MMAFTSVAEAQAAIEAHPICESLTITSTRYVVFYPSAYRVSGGVSVMRGSNDLAALNVLYERIDTFWKSQRLQIAKS